MSLETSYMYMYMYMYGGTAGECWTELPRADKKVRVKTTTNEDRFRRRNASQVRTRALTHTLFAGTPDAGRSTLRCSTVGGGDLNALRLRANHGGRGGCGYYDVRDCPAGSQSGNGGTARGLVGITTCARPHLRATAVVIPVG